MKQKQVEHQIGRIVITELALAAAVVRTYQFVGVVRTYQFVGLAQAAQINHFRVLAKRKHYFKGRQAKRKHLEEQVKQQVRQTHRCFRRGLQTVVIREQHSCQVGCKCSLLAPSSCP